MSIKKLLAIPALVVGVVGCGGGPGSKALDEMDPAPLSSRAHVNSWAVLGSAPAVAGYAVILPSILQLAADGQSCPSTTVDGNTTTVKGDCTDETGVKWTGKLINKRDSANSTTGTLTFEGFGMSDPSECGAAKPERQTFDGTVKQGGTTAETTLDINLRLELSTPDQDCAVVPMILAYDYQATVKGAQSGLDTTGAGTWSGKGRIGISELGVVNAETIDEVIDRTVCEEEPASGKTTFKSGSHEAVITYDGATACSDPSSVNWTLDGVAQSQPLLGVSCSAMGAGSASVWGLLALGGLALRRRRNS